MEIQYFAALFITMQSKRHEADYDPFAGFYKFEVNAYIDEVETAIASFEAAPAKHRRLFAAWILFKQR